MKNTLIEWAHHTVNFWWGCTKVSGACLHCYAELLARLFSRGKATWGPTGARWVRDVKAGHELIKLDESAGGRGVRERVFINSMSDTFEDRPDLEAARTLLWSIASDVPNLDILLLTKRPENVRRMVPAHWLCNWPVNVWIGTTAEDQENLERRVRELRQIPAAVRFLSCEPLLGDLELFTPGTVGQDVNALDGRAPGARWIDWVIVGGESGAGARPMHPAWARKLRDDCVAGGVPFFFKQWGEWGPEDDADPTGANRATSAGKPRRTLWMDWTGHVSRNPDDSKFTPRILKHHADPFFTETDPVLLYRYGKGEAGRFLAGREWNEVPAR